MDASQPLAFVVIVAMFGGYLAVALLPWWIARERNRADAGFILLVSTLLGWTVAGWLVALWVATRTEPARESKVIR